MDADDGDVEEGWASDADMRDSCGLGNEILRIFHRSAGRLWTLGFLEILAANPAIILDSPAASNAPAPHSRCTKARMLVDATDRGHILMAGLALGYFGIGFQKEVPDLEGLTHESRPFLEWLYSHRTHDAWCNEVAACLFLVDWSDVEDWYPTLARERYREQIGSMLRGMVLCMAPNSSIIFRKTGTCQRAGVLRTLAGEFGLDYSEDSRHFRLDWQNVVPSTPDAPSGIMPHFSALGPWSLSDWKSFLSATPERPEADVLPSWPLVAPSPGKSPRSTSSSRQSAISP